MAEKRTEVRTFIVRLMCDKCGDGEMKPTGIALLSHPPQYPHKCDKCEAETTIRSGGTYPRIEHEEVTHNPAQTTETNEMRNPIQPLAKDAQRGGAGRGQGRKPIKEGQDTVTVSLRMTEAQRDKLALLGGAEWVRQRIDKAKAPNVLGNRRAAFGASVLTDGLCGNGTKVGAGDTADKGI